MGVYTFVCKKSGESWTAKQHSGDLEASGDSTFDLQRKLVQSALNSGDSGAVQSSFSYITPSSAVAQVIIGGAVVAAVAGGATAAAPAAGGAAAEAPKEEKKEEEKEEESDEDLGMGLFD